MPKGRRRIVAPENKPIEQYTHTDKDRVNIPPVGLVTPDTDKDAGKQKTPPSLFLHTIIFNERAGYREFDRLMTVEINPSGINVWNERYF